MLGFRRKILISHALLFFVFVGLFWLFSAIPDSVLRKRLLAWGASDPAAIDSLCYDLRLYGIAIGAGVFLLYSGLIGWIFCRLSHPLQQIINAIWLQEKTGQLPRIASHSPLLQGEFGKLAILLNSLTERIEVQIRSLRQQKKDTEEVLQSLSEGVVAVDPSGRVDFINHAASKMLGVGCNTILGCPFTALDEKISPLIGQCHELLQQVLQTFEPCEQVWVGSSTQGNRIYLNLSAVCRIGQNGVILVLQDKTSDYRMVEMGKDFIANASHELRTPITIIQGFAETLRDHPNLPAHMLDEIAGKIVRTSGRLNRLIKGLLTLADIENFSVESVQTLDVVLLASHCKQLLLASSPGALVKISSSVSRALVAGDPILLDLALMNLLENAVKYSAEPANIELRIEKEAQRVRIGIQDLGIGVPPEDLPYIFDRFYTVDKARSRKSGGAGLGLSIVKTIIEKHQGKVVVESTLGKGSLFTVILPEGSTGSDSMIENCQGSV